MLMVTLFRQYAPALAAGRYCVMLTVTVGDVTVPPVPDGAEAVTFTVIGAAGERLLIAQA